MHAGRGRLRGNGRYTDADERSLVFAAQPWVGSMSFYSQEELELLGFRRLGRHVLLSRRAAIHGAPRISIGDETRIDDFCLISAGEGGVEIGAHVHLAVMSSLIGKASIVIGDYCGVSGKASIYSSSDDFSGEWMTNPTLPAIYTNVQSAPVILHRHAVMGAGAVALPGTVLGEGAILGALSLAKGELAPFWIHGGTPAHPLRERSRRLLELEHEFTTRQSAGTTDGARL